MIITENSITTKGAQSIINVGGWGLQQVTAATVVYSEIYELRRRTRAHPQFIITRVAWVP